MKTVDITYRYEARHRPARPQPVDADAARHRLDEGNRAFAALFDDLAEDGRMVQRVIPVELRDLGLLPDDEKAPTQRPFAVVLGCSDARVPVELIFNEGPNDLFVVRVAGNGLGNEVLGSLSYAIENLRPKIVAVLGHSCCGAVSAAVDVFLNPSRYLPLATNHSLRSIVDRLLVVTQASANKLREFAGPDVTRRPRYPEALIEVAISLNAALAAYTLRQEIGRHDQNGLRAVAASIFSRPAGSGRPMPETRSGAGWRIRRPISRRFSNSEMPLCSPSASPRFSIRDDFNPSADDHLSSQRQAQSCKQQSPTAASASASSKRRWHCCSCRC